MVSLFVFFFSGTAVRECMLHKYKSISSHEGTCRCNISLGHVSAKYPWDMYPQHFSCLCTCCDFFPATCPRYTSLQHGRVSVHYKFIYFFFCRCNMSLQHDPSCLPTFKVFSKRFWTIA